VVDGKVLIREGKGRGGRGDTRDFNGSVFHLGLA
jgi:hypothetical protein